MTALKLAGLAVAVVAALALAVVVVLVIACAAIGAGPEPSGDRSLPCRPPRLVVPGDEDEGEEEGAGRGPS